MVGLVSLDNDRSNLIDYLVVARVTICNSEAVSIKNEKEASVKRC